MNNKTAHNRCDLSDRHFGKLVALHLTGETRNRSCVWLCRCECGNTVEATARDLNRRAVKSCGCLRHRPPAESHAIKQNLHFLNGTCIENLIASQKRPITNKTGVRGVYQRPKELTYTAYIGFQGKAHYIGSYQTIHEAAAARQRAEQELYAPILSQYANTMTK